MSIIELAPSLGWFVIAVSSGLLAVFSVGVLIEIIKFVMRP